MIRPPLLLLSALLCLPFGLAGSTESLDSVLDDQRLHGHASPRLALERLLALGAPGPGASQEQRRRYHAAVAMQAIAAGDTGAEASAVTALESMGRRERCSPCQLQGLVRRAWRAEAVADGGQLRDLLMRLDALPASSEPELQLERLMIGAAGARLLGRHEQALAHAKSAAQLATTLPHPADRVTALTLLARTHLDRHDAQSALGVAEQAYRHAERIGFVHQQVQLRRLQAKALPPTSPPQREMDLLRDALRLASGTRGLEALELQTLLDLSRFHYRRGLFPPAIGYAARAETLSRRLDRPDLRAAALTGQAAALIHAGRRQEGLPLLSEALTLSEQHTDPTDTLALLGEAADLYEHAGRSAEAIATLRKQTLLAGQLTGQQREQALIEAQDRMSAERRAQQADRRQIEQARQRAETDLRALLVWLWVLSAAVLVLAAMLAWRSRAQPARPAQDEDEASARPPLDPLTGAYARRHCDWLMSHQPLPQQGRSRDRQVEPLVSLMLLDIDHFRRINDCHGHAAGDAVLVAITRRLQSLLREKDAVVRWGGDELVLLLPGTGPDGLATVAARALAVIGEEPVDIGSARVSVTVSAGAVCWPAFAGQHWMEAIDMADHALYLAKSAGRNRATCVVALSPDADLDRARRDLAEASQAGDVELVTVDGPTGWMIAAAVA